MFVVHHKLFVSCGFVLFVQNILSQNDYTASNFSKHLVIFKYAQESLCADSASFDLPSVLLSACISEAQECVELAAARRNSLNDVSVNPENFAILKGQSWGLDREYNVLLYVKEYDMSVLIFALFFSCRTASKAAGINF